VTRVLKEKGSVALFPEAAHSGKRQMLPHKKAIPRIALESEEKYNFNLGLQIVPVGIYYDHYWNFNRTLIVNYGEPIEIDSYKSRYAENPQNAMLQLRDEINLRLSPLTMQINSIGSYQDYEDIRMVAGMEFAQMKYADKCSVYQLFTSEQELIAKLEQFEENQPDKFEAIKKNSKNYLTVLKKAGVTNEQFVVATHSNFPKLLLRFIISVLSFPIFAFGLIFNVLPYFLPRKILAGKVKDHAFMSTFIFASGLVLYPLIYLLESGILWITTGSFLISFVALLSMPFAGKIAFNLLLLYQNLLKSVGLRYFRKARYNKCRQLRSEVIRSIQ